MKIVREHINEKFTQDSDPIADMNIGMMHQIKLWMESINEPFRDKDNALVYSAAYGKLDFVEYLLAAGADVHAINDYALRYASVYGHTEVVKVLLAAGANVHANDDGALQLASHSGHTGVVKVLLAAGANVHANDDGALQLASNNGHTEVVKVLLAAGADVHADNDLALQLASHSGHTGVVKVLLAAGANVHANDDGALRWASDKGHTEVVKILKDHITNEKRKKVKESVNEKFTEDSDPIKDLSIGINVRRKFNTQDEMYNWLSYNLQGILDPDRPLDDILTDILNDPGGTGIYLGVKYYSKLTQYANQYLSSIDRDCMGVYPKKFHLFLKNKYPHIKSWIIDGGGKY